MAERLHFVIVSLPRTGSTYLVDYLDSIEGIRCLSEIFHPNEIMLRHHKAIDPTLMDMAARDVDPLGYLDRVEAEIGDFQWFGFKHFPRHGASLLRQLCASPDWKKIFLWRDNLLEQYLSFLLASAHFGQITWGRVPDQRQINVPVQMVLDDLQTIQQNYFAIENALALASPDDLFALEYEDLGRLSVVRELLQFLRLPAAVTGRALERGTSSDDELRFSRGPTAAERIQNYGEIQQFLRTTRYRRWVGA